MRSKPYLHAEQSRLDWDVPGLLAGVDEAGRGPLAGPVVVAAVVFPPGRTPVNGLDDSKALTARKREALYPRIIERALAKAKHEDRAAVEDAKAKAAFGNC
mgnify:CR=1 FL=1